MSQPRSRLSFAERRTIYGTLCDIHDAKGCLPNGRLRAVATAYRVSPRTIRRIWERGTDALVEKPPLALTDGQLRAVLAAHGNLKQAWKNCTREGDFTKSYRTFVNRFHNLEPLDQIAYTQGGRAAAASGLSVLQLVDRRNDVWHFDHTMADVDVYYRNRVGRPWLSVLIDAHSRMILSGVVTFGDGEPSRPDGPAVVALVAEAMMGWEHDESRYGGIPGVILFDNALEHLTQQLTNGLGMFGVYGRLIPKGSPWRQGKIEKVIQTVTNEYMATLDGYTAGIEDRWGRIHSRTNPTHLDDFIAGLDAYIEEYNHERVHQGLHGDTPATAWNADDGPVRFAEHDQVRRFFLTDGKSRTVHSRGVMVGGKYFTCAALNRHLGDSVLVRRPPKRHDFVDCYTTSGELIGTAKPHAALTTAERRDIAAPKERAAGRVTRRLRDELRRRRQAEQRADVVDSFGARDRGGDDEVADELLRRLGVDAEDDQ